MSFFSPHPIVGNLGDFTVTAHSIAFAMAAVVAVAVLARDLKYVGVKFVDGVQYGVVLFIIALFAARFGYLVSYSGEWTELSQLFALWEGGLVSFWGIAAGIAVGWFQSRHVPSEKRVHWVKSVILAGLLGWSIGRWGNYYMGESGGVASSFWSLTYGRVPIQLLESFYCLGLWVWLRKVKRPAAQVAWLGVASYLAGRFIIDIWRDESVIVGLHVSQLAALIGLAVMGGLYARAFRR